MTVALALGLGDTSGRSTAGGEIVGVIELVVVVAFVTTRTEWMTRRPSPAAVALLLALGVTATAVSLEVGNGLGVGTLLVTVTGKATKLIVSI